MPGGTIPANATVICPRCKILRPFVNVSAGLLLYRCGGCEWEFTATAVAPTSTGTAAVSAGGTAITVASGGASFTNGMVLVYDTGGVPEIVTVNGSSTGTSVPVAGQYAGQVRGGFAEAHGSSAAFGQLGFVSTFSSVGEDAVPAAPGWGF